MTQSSLGLNTSKRKFYKLLDNLSSSKTQLPSEKNASTTTLAPEPPNKRFRLLNRDKDRPLTAPSSTARPTSLGTSERPSSSVASGFAGRITAKPRPKSYVAGRAGAEANSPETKSTPNYTPWSHDQFLSRLKTFADVRSWTPKPAAVGEVEWAKRGWTVVGKDTVGCKGGCEKRLVVKIAVEKNEEAEQEEEEGDADWWIGDVEREMVNRYQDLIVAAHGEDCLWRKAACKDDIYRIKMADPAIWQWELRERYLSLLYLEDTLPDNLELPGTGTEDTSLRFDIDELAKLIPPNILERPPKEKENTNPESTDSGADAEGTTSVDPIVNKTALAMAILGWTGQSPNGVQLAYCTKCFQRAGLWLYRSSPSTFASTPSLIDAEALSFDPIEQHREHCPWKNPTAQCALGRLEGLAGWQVLVSLIKGYRRHDQTPKKSEEAVNAGEEESPRKSREELEGEDKVRRGRLQRLKRAFTVSSKGKK